ncbi:MAG: twin-arginine translocase TatA/TatE family subunit [Ghiorsea sp.]|nr:twin-arginine translocase TatA/TatE family subunit [Ghiorsea sp.]
MPDIGMIELILIGLIGFLVLGPERLPEFLGQIAKIVKQGRGWVNSLKKQLEYEKHTLSQPLQDATQDVNISLTDTKKDIEESLKDMTDATVVEKKDK